MSFMFSNMESILVSSLMFELNVWKVQWHCGEQTALRVYFDIDGPICNTIGLRYATRIYAFLFVLNNAIIS